MEPLREPLASALSVALRGPVGPSGSAAAAARFFDRLFTLDCSASFSLMMVSNNTFQSLVDDR